MLRICDNVIMKELRNQVPNVSLIGESHKTAFTVQFYIFSNEEYSGERMKKLLLAAFNKNILGSVSAEFHSHLDSIHNINNL